MSQTTPLFCAIDCESLPVDNLEAAIDFYSHTLGHELIWRTDDAAGLRLPHLEAELVLHTDGRPMETDLKVSSVPEAIDRFARAGGELVAGPFEIAIGLCAVIADWWQNHLIILDSSKGLLEVDGDKRVVPKGGA
jgi:lactoylglutathione lyase